jgi:hypothetical protein
MERIIAEIEFGNPRLDCDRFGICRISSTDSVILLPMRLGVGLGEWSQKKKNEILLRLFPESLSDATKAKYFAHNSLIIEEDAAPNISEAFGKDWQGLIFKAGIYAFDSDWQTKIDFYLLEQPETQSDDKQNFDFDFSEQKNLVVTCKCHAKAA